MLKDGGQLGDRTTDEKRVGLFSLLRMESMPHLTDK
jgi:hypothetical protein